MQLTVDNYAAVDAWEQSFFSPDGMALMVVVSDPGKGKSKLAERLAREHDAVYIKAAQLTEFQFFLRLYEHRHKNFVLDDVETLIQPNSRHTLQNLCETDYGPDGKEVGWYGSTSLLKVHRGKKVVHVPQTFRTRSRVLVLSNDWAILTKQIGPLLSRGLVLFFDPANQTCHDFARGWFLLDDEDAQARKTISEYIARNLERCGGLDLRWYDLCLRLHKQGRDWRAVLEETWTQQVRAPRLTSQRDVYEEVQDLAQVEKMTEAEKAKLFKELCDMYGIVGGSRASYFRIKRERRQ
jgi:hypothetical protein